ncbi:DUF3795 domain-containing protein, partial [Chloroflexota bacterium]
YAQSWCILGVLAMKQSFGNCGLDCEACPVFIARATNDDELRVQTAKEWSELYAEYLGHSLKPSDMNCNGCHSDNTFVGCQSCPIKKCGQVKGFTSCADCKEYESCEMLNGFYSVPSHQQAKTNLDKMRAR